MAPADGEEAADSGRGRGRQGSPEAHWLRRDAAAATFSSGLLDIGCDGSVQCAQLRRFFQTLRGAHGGPLSDADIDTVLGTADCKGDGRVHYAEFVTWLVNGDDAAGSGDQGLAGGAPKAGGAGVHRCESAADREALDEVERIAKAEAQRRMAEFERRAMTEAQRKARDAAERDSVKAEARDAAERDSLRAEAERRAKEDVQRRAMELLSRRPAGGEEGRLPQATGDAPSPAPRVADAELRAEIEARAFQEAAIRARDRIESKVRDEVARRLSAFAPAEAEHAPKEVGLPRMKVEEPDAEPKPAPLPDPDAGGKRAAAGAGAKEEAPSKRPRGADAEGEAAAAAGAESGSPASDRPASSAPCMVGPAGQDEDIDFADEESEIEVAAALNKAVLSAMAAAHDPQAPQARLIELLSGDVHELPINGTISIGRRPTCEVVVNMPCVSSRHCVLNCSAGRVELEDVSSFGTYVNSTLVPKDGDSEEDGPPHVVLQHGDRLTLARRHGPPALLFLGAQAAKAELG